MTQLIMIYIASGLFNASITTEIKCTICAITVYLSHITNEE